MNNINLLYTHSNFIHEAIEMYKSEEKLKNKKFKKTKDIFNNHLKECSLELLNIALVKFINIEGYEICSHISNIIDKNIKK